MLEGTTNLSVSVIVGQIRSTATDLLTGIGLTYEEATEAVRTASVGLAAPSLTGRPSQSAPAKGASYALC